MPKKLESFAFASGSNASYNWKQLLDGSIWELKQGEDFNCKITTFATLARKQASIAGVSLRTSTNKPANTFTLQAVPKDGSKPARTKAAAAAPATKDSSPSQAEAKAPTEKQPVPKRVSRSKVAK